MFLIFLEEEVGELFQGGQDTLIWCSPFSNYCKMCNLSLERKGLFPGKVAVENVNEYIPLQDNRWREPNPLQA